MVIEGVVVRGQRLGRTLGFPTANVVIQRDVVVEDGVYLSTIELDGVRYDGVTNVGVNPTVGGVERRAESYMFDFDEDIYGRVIRVELRDRLRGEVRFDGLEALRAQVLRDVELAKAIVSAANKDKK